MPGLLGKLAVCCAVLALGGLLAAPANAQRVVCSKAMHASTCNQLAVPVERELRLLHARADWNWVILDNQDWRTATRMFHTEGLTNKAFTVLGQRTTFLRGEFLEQRRPRPMLDVLAHEMAHAQCDCRSEARANQISQTLMASMDRKAMPASGP
jgi:hypothetical protein